MEMDAPQLRWSVGTRLEFLEFRLFWDRRINRSDLVDFFRISVPQASADLSRYQQLAPENMLYDRNAKTYRATEGFRPILFDPSADQVLAQLRLLEAGLIQPHESWTAEPPPYAVVPMPRRRIDPHRLRGVLDAIRARAAVRVEYQSMSRVEPAWRWISPHAMAFDGRRWHVRAWCHEHGDFRDFVLARILSQAEARPSDSDPGLDGGWRIEVTLRLAPHPVLSPAQRRALEVDYGMTGGVLEMDVKLCLFYYVDRILGLDPEAQRLGPERVQLSLLNRAEVLRRLGEAGEGHPAPGEAGLH